jgi:hypothetical protein
LLEQSPEFAKSIESFLNDNPNDENFIVFSLIPAIYSSFWCHEEYQNFWQLFNSLSVKQISFARLFIAHPSLHIFFSSFQENLLKIDSDKIHDLSTILDLIKNQCFLFPSFFKNLFTTHSDPSQIFIDFFLIHILLSPSLYGLVSPYHNISFDNLIKDIPAHRKTIDSIIEILRHCDCSSQFLPVESSVEKIVSENDQYIYFLRNDLNLLSKISKRSFFLPEGNELFPHKLPQNIYSKSFTN